MFIRHLSNILDQQDTSWRQKTIITLDGAPYHFSSESLTVYSGLRLPIMFQPPHAYNVAPAELVFAALKSKHMNPDGLPTGRLHFLNVLKMIIRRLKEIPHPTYVLYWHHCLQHTLRYPKFDRL